MLYNVCKFFVRIQSIKKASMPNRKSKNANSKGFLYNNQHQQLTTTPVSTKPESGNVPEDTERVVFSCYWQCLKLKLFFLLLVATVNMKLMLLQLLYAALKVKLPHAVYRCLVFWKKFLSGLANVIMYLLSQCNVINARVSMSLRAIT